MRKLVLLGLALIPVMSATAQGPELGLSIGTIGFTHTDGSTETNFNVGGGSVSLGLFLSSGLAIQPVAALSYFHTDGGSLTELTLGANLPIYLDHTWGHSGVFIAPGAGIRVADAGDGSNSQAYVGVSVGTKMKVSDPVSFSLGVTLNQFLSSSDNVSATQVFGFFGVSVFFKK